MKINSIIFIGLLIHVLWIMPAYTCTNLIVTKGASVDGSVFITYAADSHTRYGALSFYPAADHPRGMMLDVFHYESGKLMGQIPEADHTFSVVGFMNEHQVAIGESTFGGLEVLEASPGRSWTTVR